MKIGDGGADFQLIKTALQKWKDLSVVMCDRRVHANPSRRESVLNDDQKSFNDVYIRSLVTERMKELRKYGK